MPVVVVESPAKAKTINKYLGDGYTVLASYGHVRDLPPKDGSVDPENGFDMTWEVGADSRKHVKAIADALKDDQTLILATDPDREGEATQHTTRGLLARLLDIGKNLRRRAILRRAKTTSLLGSFGSICHQHRLHEIRLIQQGIHKHRLFFSLIRKPGQAFGRGFM